MRGVGQPYRASQIYVIRNAGSQHLYGVLHLPELHRQGDVGEDDAGGAIGRPFFALPASPGVGSEGLQSV